MRQDTASESISWIFFFLFQAVKMSLPGSGKDLPGSHLANQDEEAGMSIIKVVSRFCFKASAWFGIYVLGYYNFSVAWLLTPLLLTVLR